MADVTLPPLTVEMKARFWAKVKKGADTDCWLWSAAINPGGYGIINLNRWIGSTCLATHVALAIKGEPRPERGLALHSCDNRACVNPAHLRWGSHQDNANDMVKRHRAHPAESRRALMLAGARRGEQHACAKLTENDVRSMRVDARSDQEIASELGVSRRTIRDARSRKTWRVV